MKTRSLLVSSFLETAPSQVVVRPFLLPGRVRPGSSSGLSQLHQLKRKLLRGVLEATPGPALYKRLCGAANQAAGLAWETAHPVLVFPCLFEELVQELHRSQLPPDPADSIFVSTE